MITEEHPDIIEGKTDGEPSVDKAESGAEVEKYSFDAAFQTKICALAVRDTKFMQQVDGLIRSEYFENGIEARWFDAALSYFTRYKKVPSDVSVYWRYLKERVELKKLDRDTAILMGKHYREVLETTDLSDREYVVDQVASFARHQAVAAAITEVIPSLRRREFDVVQTKLQKALNIGANTDGDSYDFGARIVDRTGERIDLASGKMPVTGITTGYAQIDEVLFHKGWGRKELSVLMGAAKRGKTSFLIDFGLRAVQGGFNVLYVTLEVSARIIAERMDANISDTPISEVKDRIAFVKEKVQAFMSDSGKRFVIKEFPTGSMRVSDLRRLLERYKSQGLLFDLVIVDYGDLVAPERTSDNAIENSKSVYVSLRGLAMQEDIAVLTATQTNREGAKAAVATMTHVAEDFNKIRIADIVLSINQSDEERARNEARLYFAASRNQAGGFAIKVLQAPDRMRPITKILGFD